MKHIFAACAIALISPLHALPVPFNPPEITYPPYLVIDLSGGPDAEYYPYAYRVEIPEGGWTDEYKGNKAVLHLIPAGTFIMGSPESEPGRHPDESQHRVTLSQPFYMGVFELTQKQWQLVMGSSPFTQKGDFRPAEKISYEAIRGDADATISADSFMGRLRAKTRLDFDLPTEAQWEYACRAGTTTALNTDKDPIDKKDPAMEKIARYRYNSNQLTHGKMVIVPGKPYGHTVVGSYTPNAWGLYDMHGNIAEWCRDWYATDLGIDPRTDPKGPATGDKRVVRGGSWDSDAFQCRSAKRTSWKPSSTQSNAVISESGFRIATPLPPPPAKCRCPCIGRFRIITP